MDTWQVLVRQTNYRAETIIIFANCHVLYKLLQSHSQYNLSGIFFEIQLVLIIKFHLLRNVQ